ncbi:MAG: hypothetical protein WCV80_03100 [Candidatus Paceibacterota bacterium]|jgi:hypothetical protein
MKKDKLFFYDFEGKRQTSSDVETAIVSEVKLPPFSNKFRGKCAYEGYTVFKRIPLGTKLTLAFGDPRIIEGATLVSKKKSDVTKDVLGMLSGAERRIFTFEYQGKKFWVDPCWICRLEDLSKK